MDLDLLDDIDVSSDQGEIEVVRGDVAALNRHYDEIAAQGGVCRNTAQMLVRDCAVQLPDYAPVSSFTEVPSRTNLSVAMEGIFSTIAHHTIEIIKKAAALLVKITRWIMDALRKHLGLKKDAEKQVKGIVALSDVVQKHPNLNGTELSHETDHLAQLYNKAVRELDDVHRDYKNGFNDLIADMLGPRRFTTLVRHAGIDLLSYHDAIEIKLSLFTDLLHGKVNAGASVLEHALIAQLNTVAKPIMVAPHLKAQITGAGVPVGSDSLIDVCNGVRMRCTEMRSTRTAPAVSYEQAVEQIKHNIDEFTSPYITNPQSWLDTLHALDKQLHDLQTVSSAIVPSQEASKAFLAANETITKEITALRQFYVTTVACETVRNQFNDEVFDMFMFTTKAMNAKAAMLKDEQAQAELRKDMNKAGALIRAA